MGRSEGTDFVLVLVDETVFAEGDVVTPNAEVTLLRKLEAA